MEKHTLFISDERKFELFKKHYAMYLGGTLECITKETNGTTTNIVTFPSDLPTTMLMQYVWAIGVSTGLELCQSIINGTHQPDSLLDKGEKFVGMSTSAG